VITSNNGRTRYDHWQGVLYPRGASSLERLDAYARRFGTVEVNFAYFNNDGHGHAVHNALSLREMPGVGTFSGQAPSSGNLWTVPVGTCAIVGR